ncbi:cation diffusion facilitator family transporter [Halobacillus rhizosphaerae]|uniref:cation diffusion facilitator family transporter n=1 Tax=Halobacillus rhizosphaerae TaxID=3064889 RepID=UPI00398B80DA
MAHQHEHDHDHHDHDHSDLFHSHAPAGKMKQAFFLAMIILAAELVFGILSHSLALLADAWHMATDVLAIGLAWFALHISKKSADKTMTFGYERAGILAAALNGLTLIGITIWILYSAIERIINPVDVGGWGMFAGAGIGLVVNLIIIFVLNGDEDNLNVKAALLHVIGDVGASAGVIIAGIIIHFTGWYIIDPIISLIIAVIIAFSAWNICKQSFRILMESKPKNVEIDQVIQTMKKQDAVADLHDLHVWSITSGKNALACHLVLKEDVPFSEHQQILRTIEHDLAHIGIGHVTIQIEDHNHPHEEDTFCAMKDDGDAHAH